ncbi:uncharacterized protein STEHIDRAFT_62984 [Stereum hirsutum FP-91666 SS1]|uniref:uncharacterized protein n=1 Tax=Stereum hirsutum (strain FP-91666) TaxID=721885 RepID=UPI000444A2CF|nr:uncharacterized protein STEHIDRAFT_62984 [Stereum hirsutum FP-91666 SS1]EIM83630.1 hypothetical protein STEHIDRAFT_62984 [Stereum hirsutum FP-91666 SS1]
MISELSHAELQACSQLPRVLPRPIYLYHQSSFHTLGDVYHAHMRRYRFELHTTRIEAGKVVQITAYSAGGDGEPFLDSSQVSLHRIKRSSFGELLSSAISSDLPHFMASSPPASTMFSSGSVWSSSSRNSLPVDRMETRLSEGMSEGLGRLKREMRKVRSTGRGPTVV